MSDDMPPLPEGLSPEFVSALCQAADQAIESGLVAQFGGLWVVPDVLVIELEAASRPLPEPFYGIKRDDGRTVAVITALPDVVEGGDA